ncbi:GntR family transcriptional regulator [bacterium]|nr:GntR family transcriptional regulator [bacterium]
MAIQQITNNHLYEAVYEALRDRIIAGDHQPGDALPSEPKLREEFGVSTITVRRAIHELALDGLVEPRQGVGNIVRRPADSSVVIGMSSFTTDVAHGRLRLVRTLLVDETVSAASDTAERLQVQPGSMLRRLVRLDSEGNAPLSIDEVFIPPVLASVITSDIAASPTFMHLWQETSGLQFVRTQYEIWAEKSSPDDQRTLQIDPECPVLVTGELIQDNQSRPCAWIVSRYRADRGRLSGTVVLAQKKTKRGVIGE